MKFPNCVCQISNLNIFGNLDYNRKGDKKSVKSKYWILCCIILLQQWEVHLEVWTINTGSKQSYYLSYLFILHHFWIVSTYLHVLQDIIIPRKLRMSPTIDYFLKTTDHGPTENQCTEPSTISHFTHQATCHLANDQLTGCRQRTWK